MQTSRPSKQFSLSLSSIIGVALVAVGIVFLIVNYFKTSWVLFLIAPLIGLFLVIVGVTKNKFGYSLAGDLLLFVGAGLFFAMNQSILFTAAQKIGIVFLSFCLGWLMVFIMGKYIHKYRVWWAFIPVFVFGALGMCFYFSQLRLLDFVLYLGLAAGFSLLLPGVIFRLLGLIIPGCLVIFASAGVYVGWGSGFVENALAQTGAMLVVFAIGWCAITLFNRVIHQKFVWWPLIPGGVLAVTGWGLYIGGDPGNAVNFIGNTGSISLIIFGLYLLLMRKGLKR